MRQPVAVSVIEVGDKTPEAGNLNTSDRRAPKAKYHPSLNQWRKNALITVCINWPLVVEDWLMIPMHCKSLRRKG